MRPVRDRRDVMLPLNELKQALEHDKARRAPDVIQLPDYPGARRLMRDGVSEVMEAGDALFQQPGDLATVRAKLAAAIAKLETARASLAVHQEGDR